MSLKVEGKQFTIANLFGEKVPRVPKIPWTPAEVEVRVESKTDFVVKGADREKGLADGRQHRACVQNQEARQTSIPGRRLHYLEGSLRGKGIWWNMRR
ncbi:MAG: hypothetical protein Ct9H300mP30_0270 [Methanobacteriota archaeon]|nr:MAG: hypothetical protein Ct9H300mP30_0270 [Euryarchaeota archaeon]